MTIRKSLICIAALSAISTPAFADLVWPALYLESRILTRWAIGLGLLAEFFVVWALFGLSWWKAASATLCANAASTLVGGLAIPFAGIIWEFFPGSLYKWLFHWGTFNLITWVATFLLACLINTWIETLVYKHSLKIVIRRREFVWIFFANSLSVGLAFGSLFVFPPQS